MKKIKLKQVKENGEMEKTMNISLNIRPEWGYQRCYPIRI